MKKALRLVSICALAAVLSGCSTIQSWFSSDDDSTVSDKVSTVWGNVTNSMEDAVSSYRSITNCIAQLRPVVEAYEASKAVTATTVVTNAVTTNVTETVETTNSLPQMGKPIRVNTLNGHAGAWDIEILPAAKEK